MFRYEDELQTEIDILKEQNQKMNILLLDIQKHLNEFEYVNFRIRIMSREFSKRIQEVTK